MKRYLLILLTALVFWGCAAEPQPETTLPAPSETQATETTVVIPDGLYDAESYLDAATSGALQVYPLNRSDAIHVVRMGQDLLLFSGENATTLTKLTGDTRYISAVANLNCIIRADDPAVQVSEKGVTYYDEAARQLVFLDANLKEGARVSLPAQMIGRPALSANRKNLYYHTESSIRTIDLDSGIDSLLLESSFTVEAITALHCADSIIGCRILDATGIPSTLFVSVKNGEALGETRNELPLYTSSSRYFTLQMDGIYCEYLTGAVGEPANTLHYNSFITTAHPVLDANGVVIQSTTAQETTNLEFINLETGKRTGHLEYPGMVTPESVIADAAGTGVWFLCYDENYGSQILCHWEPARSTIADERIYVVDRFTLQNPDREGLAQCQALADQIRTSRGVKVIIGADAAKENSPSMTLESEYQSWVILQALEKLDRELSIYPSNFLDQLTGPTGSPLRICLVRSMTSWEAEEDLTCLLYRDQAADPYIYLPVTEDWESDFQHQLFHVIESYVIMSCPTYDSWNSLNPKGFQYALRYNVESSDALQPLVESGAFVNLYATSFPKEDRAMTMMAALASDNEGCFESKVMQSKLQLLCTGIRKAFGYQKSNQVFLWEQYLK